jgi:hypothetical protein
MVHEMELHAQGKDGAHGRWRNSGQDLQGCVEDSDLIGTDPAVDDCLTARFVPCTPKTDKNKCKDPK